jgi:hypothetical protein
MCVWVYIFRATLIATCCTISTQYDVFIHSRNTIYLKLDFGIVSFEGRLITDVWTQNITPLFTENNFILYKLILRNLIFNFNYKFNNMCETSAT